VFNYLYPGSIFKMKKKSGYFLQTYYSSSIIILFEFMLPKLVAVLFTCAFVTHTIL